MAQLLIRNLDQQVKDRLAARAAANNRSMEAEAREILASATAAPNLAVALLELGAEIGGVDLPVPPREGQARWAELD